MREETESIGRRLTTAQIVELARSLRATLTGIQARELVASGATVHRIEGAVAALEAVLGRRSSLLTDLTIDSK
jgi:hypothetical protein